MKVKKEISLAIIIGLIIALLVAGGILRARRALQTIQLPSLGSNASLLPTTAPNASALFLDLTTPDNTVTKEPVLILSGKTLPGTYIAILGEKGEYLIVPNDLGSFSQEITLLKGANNIKITVYEQSGNKFARTLSVVYTTAEI